LPHFSFVCIGCLAKNSSAKFQEKFENDRGRSKVEDSAFHIYLSVGKVFNWDGH